MTAANDPPPDPPAFSTVIIARSPQDAPTELEFALRKQANKFRVVEKLHGGADLLVCSSDSTIAVKVYYAVEEDFDSDESFRAWNHGKIPRNRDLLDEFRAFRDAFQHPLVVFILPDMRDQLSRADSLMNVATMLLSEPSKGGTAENHQGRVFCVPSTQMAMQSIAIVQKPLTNHIREKRSRYYQHLLSLQQPSVEQEFRDLLYNRLESAAGEAEILMQHFGSLHKIAIASHLQLRNVPIEDESKLKLLAFFGVPPDSRDPVLDSNRDAAPSSPKGRGYDDEDPMMTGDDLLQDNYFPDYHQFQNEVCEPYYPEEQTPSPYDHTFLEASSPSYNQPRYMPRQRLEYHHSRATVQRQYPPRQHFSRSQLLSRQEHRQRQKYSGQQYFHTRHPHAALPPPRPHSTAQQYPSQYPFAPIQPQRPAMPRPLPTLATARPLSRRGQAPSISTIRSGKHTPFRAHESSVLGQRFG